MQAFIKNLGDIRDPEKFNDLIINIFKDLPFHIYWKDQDGIYLGCNDTQARTTGLAKADDILGGTDFDFCWYKSAPILRKNDERVFTQNRPISVIESSFSSYYNKLISYTSYKVPFKTTKKTLGVIGFSVPVNGFLSDITPTFDEAQPNIASQSVNLTSRQADCLYYLAQGMTAKAIASTLQLSVRTVEHYIENIKHKLGCYSRSDLINKALQLDSIRLRLLQAR